MNSEHYKQALEQARRELANAITQRDTWNLQIIRAQDLVQSLAAKVAEEENAERYQAEVNAYVDLMQAIEAIVNGAPGPVTPIEVRDGLTFYGYDLSHYANPMAMVHQTLKRLTADRHIQALPDGRYLRNLILANPVHVAW